MNVNRIRKLKTIKPFETCQRLNIYVHTDNIELTQEEMSNAIKEENRTLDHRTI